MKRSGDSLVESVRDLPGLAAFGRKGRMNINEAIKLVADKYKLSHNPDDYTFIVLKALHANKPNDNGDAFPMEELDRYSEKYGCKVYETFILKPHFVEHNQSGPAYGFVLDAHLEKTGENEGYVELVIAVDTKKDPIYGALAKAGRIKTFSMGCTVGSTVCSICGNKAASEKEFCEHVRDGKMKTFKVADESGQEIDKIAYEDCFDVVYDEISGVGDPADKGAIFEEKLGTKKVRKGSYKTRSVGQTAFFDAIRGEGKKIPEEEEDALWADFIEYESDALNETEHIENWMAKRLPKKYAGKRTKKVGMRRTAKDVVDEVRLINKEIKKSQGSDISELNVPEEDSLTRVYTQYIKRNNSYYPAGDVVLKANLDARPYEVESDMSGLYFTKVRPLTDELLVFSNSAMNSVVREVDKFWSSKEAYKKLGLTHNRGILLYGPPGTGKSVCLQQVADLMARRGDVVFFVKSAHIIVDALKAFRDVEPDRKVVVAFEEADEFCEYNERDMLRVMDGDAKIDGVLFLATTNYIDRLPPRMLRPGRFDRKVFVDYPEYDTRLQYLSQKLSKIGVDEEKVKVLAKKSEGLGFGHMRELITGIYAIGDDEDKVIASLRQKVAKSAGVKKSTGKIEMKNKRVGLKKINGNKTMVLELFPDQAEKFEKMMRMGDDHIVIDRKIPRVHVPGVGWMTIYEISSHTYDELKDFLKVNDIYFRADGLYPKGWSPITDGIYSPRRDGSKKTAADIVIIKDEDGKEWTYIGDGIKVLEKEMESGKRQMQVDTTPEEGIEVVKEKESRKKRALEGEQEDWTLDLELGDLVDFGPYGQLYVLRTGQGSKGDRLWVTDEEEERFNPDSSGWYIRTSQAEKLIQKGFDAKDDVEDEDMDLEGRKTSFKVRVKKADEFTTPVMTPDQAQQPLEKGWLNYLSDDVQAQKVSDDMSAQKWFTERYRRQPTAQETDKMRSLFSRKNSLKKEKNREGLMKKREFFITAMDRKSGLIKYPGYKNWTVTFETGRRASRVTLGNGKHAFGKIVTGRTDAKRLAEAVLDDLVRVGLGRVVKKYGFGKFRSVLDTGMTDKDPGSISPREKAVTDDGVVDKETYNVKNVSREITDDAVNDKAAKRKALKLNKVRYLNARKLISTVQSLYRKHEKLDAKKASAAVSKLFTKKADGDEEAVYVDVPGLMEEVVNFWVADEDMGPEEVSEKMVDDFVETGAPDEVVEEIREEVKDMAEGVAEEGKKDEGTEEPKAPEGKTEDAGDEEELPSMDEMGMEEVEVAAAKKAREGIALYAKKFNRAMKLAVKRQLLNMDPQGMFAVKRELCERLINPADNAKFSGLRPEVAVDVIERSFRTAMSPKVLDEVIASATKLMELDDKAFVQIEEDAAGLLPVNITGEFSDTGKEARGSKILVARTGSELHGESGLDAALIRASLPSFGLGK